ncbi:MAG: methionyl-tRNA formyltransferase [Xanthomonadales bacterium]|nr:methionyl-tRNA formyltransferase [Xanthomonadales bacterium]
MRVVFAGTPDFAVPCLQSVLDAGCRPLAVLTQPDRPAGRGRQLQPSPVKQLAMQAELPVWQPERLRDEGIQQALRDLQPDLMIVVAYGLLLPRAVLDIPRLGCWNVHASLLPRWRGAAPIQRAIEAGDTETGVCLMQMERGLDTGPVLLRRHTPISATDTAQTLHDRLARLGAEVLAEGLRLAAANRLPAAEVQPASGVTYAHKLDKAEARLGWSLPAVEIARRVRAFSPWPSVELEWCGQWIKVHEAEVVDAAGEPGTRLPSSRDQLVVACGDGALRLHRVQRPGGRVVSAADLLNAQAGRVVSA